MLVPQKLDKLSGSYEQTVRCKYPEFYKFLMEKYPIDISFSERIYWYYNNITEYPKCEYCGGRVKYIKYSKGYHKYCSSKCSNSCPSVKSKKKQTIIENSGSVEESYKKRMEKTRQTLIENSGSVEESYKKRMEKTKQTNLERYGVECTLQSDDVREKTRQTNLERYGVENVMQSDHIKSYVRQTNLERYGVECTLQSDEVKEKTRQTNLERYGVEYPQQSDIIKCKTKDTLTKKLLESYPDIISTFKIGDTNMYRCRCTNTDCEKCSQRSFDISASSYYNRRIRSHELCTTISPETPNKCKDTQIELFVQNILNEYGINYVTNDRSKIGPQELDIYIPKYNIGIECNGIFWHSDKVKTKTYHYDKLNRCKDVGIDLITIWEDQIIHKPDIVKSMILSKLGIYEHRIGGRKCVVKEIDGKLCSDFLNKYHLQGNTHASIRIGLFYGEDLVSVMTFGKGRTIVGHKNTNNTFELYRYCTKSGFQIVGGFGKMLKYFIKTYNPTKLISFASNDISTGSIYKRFGFVETNHSQSYWYIDENTMNRHHRYKFNKSSLVKMGYNNELSEKCIMDNLNYFRIYDTGQTKYELSLNF